MRKTKYKIIGFFLLGLSVISCNTSKLKETPLDNFKGTWKLVGRSMFDGITIKIEENTNGNFDGKVCKLNDNKYIKLFVELNDIWITDISRSSNYEFKLIEKKIGSPLFSIYGLSTTNEYKVQFIDNNTIGLSTGNSNPLESSVRYVRVRENE
jgi:hypothetical protein